MSNTPSKLDFKAQLRASLKQTPAPADQVSIFWPDYIRQAAEKDLPACLRELADAIEAKQVDGRFIALRGSGFQHWTDKRAHVHLTIDIASEVRKEGSVAEKEQGR